jgi:hypothetical protein
MSIRHAVIRAFEKKYGYGWDEFPRMYWAIDLHGVIITSTRREMFCPQPLLPECLEVLQWLTEHDNMGLILFTGSGEEYVATALEWFEKQGIRFDHVNCNPEIGNKGFCNVDSKFYYDVLLDDKAGFNHKLDWKTVKKALEDLEEW